jgi:hypothetical protein
MNKVVFFLIVLLSITTLAGCFPREESMPGKDPAGFFTGVWHGWIAPVSLIISFFVDGFRIYEKNNTGWWYDFGFYIAIISGFGGLALTRNKKKE